MAPKTLFRPLSAAVGLCLTAVFAMLLPSGCGDDGPTDPGDTTPPTVESASPTAQTIGVDRPDFAIWVVFSEPMRESSVTPQTFVITPTTVGAYQVAGDSVGFTPSEQLAYGTTYSITLTTGLTDLAGNHLAESYGFSFATQDDPRTTPPEVIAVSPLNGAIGVSVNAAVTATFSKAMEPSSLTTTSFNLGGTTYGAVDYSAAVATLTPSDPLDYNTLYTVTVTTAAADTFGNHLESDYAWSFTTEVDPLAPAAQITWPPDNAIIGDTVTFALNASFTVETARFYAGGVLVATDDTSSPFSEMLETSTWEIGDEYELWATVHDSAGNIGYTDTITVTYLWEVLATDGNPEQLPQDVRRMLWRSTDSALELRYEYAVNWSDPINDTAVDLGVYLDIDQQALSGRTDFNGLPLNGIGA